MTWNIIYKYGSEKPIEDFIKALNTNSISKVSRSITLLQNQGNLLRMPYSKKLTKNIFELRTKGIETIRILYAFGPEKTIFLLNIFKKKTQKTPTREIKLAENRLKRYLTQL